MHWFVAAIEDVKAALSPDVQLFCQGKQILDVPLITSLDDALHNVSTLSPPRDTVTKFNGKFYLLEGYRHKIQW